MKTRQKLVLVPALAIFAVLFMYIAFTLSENIIHYHNSFIRRFPQHTAQESSHIDLKFNSYYFAGASGSKIFLGNITSPLLVTAIDTTLKTKQTFHIQLLQQKLPFRSPQIRIIGNTFYVFEGIVPYIFSGSTKDWIGSLKLNTGRFFSALEPMDSVHVSARYIQPGTNENLLGRLSLADTSKVKFNPELLQKQIDGIFDTDGILKYDQATQSLVYVYFYRNEFIVSSPELAHRFTGHTIDTVSKAHIKFAATGHGKMKTFTEPPLIVNKMIAASGGLLFVNSGLPGQYDDDRLWKTASILDVYDLKNGAYHSSFPIYDIDRKKLSAVFVSNHRLYALIDHTLVCYKLSSRIVTRR